MIHESEYEEAQGASLIPATEALQRGEIDVQVATARRYPRRLDRFVSRANAAVIVDHETAHSCTYCIPRGGKVITGPSIHFARILASLWGNIRIGTRIVSLERPNGKDVTAIVVQGVSLDLETNTARAVEVRKVTTSTKRTNVAGVPVETIVPYTEDMVNQTIAAAQSIAERESILRQIPKGLWGPIWEKAREFSRKTDERPLRLRQENAWRHFEKLGVSKDAFLRTAGVTGLYSISEEDLENLEYLAAAIEDREVTVAEVFHEDPTAPQKTMDEVVREAKARGRMKPPKTPREAEAEVAVTKRRGRPPGSKNRPKVEVVEENGVTGEEEEALTSPVIPPLQPSAPKEEEQEGDAEYEFEPMPEDQANG